MITLVKGASFFANLSTLNPSTPGIIRSVITKSYSAFSRALIASLPLAAVASGSEAINALENAEYDLVITDLMMPGVDGFKVLKFAKKLAPLTSVIILTGYGDTQSAIDALRLGADDFLRKPCEIEELVFRIRSCLVKRNLLLERKKVMQELQESKTFNLATLNALSAEIA